MARAEGISFTPQEIPRGPAFQIPRNERRGVIQSLEQKPTFALTSFIRRRRTQQNVDHTSFIQRWQERREDPNLNQKQTDRFFIDALSEFKKPPRPIKKPGNENGKYSHMGRLFEHLLHGDKVHKEGAFTVLTGTLFTAIPIGTLLIGGMNLLNAALEVKDAIRGRGKFSRAGLYLVCAGAEFGWFAIGQTFFNSIASSLIKNGVIARAAGTYMAAFAGMVTGTITNTFVWEIEKDDSRERNKRKAVRNMTTALENGDELKIRQMIASVNTDISQLKNNINNYLGNDGEITELQRTQSLQNQLNRRRGNRLTRIAIALPKIALNKYYEREISNERIKQQTANALLDMLQKLHP